MLLLFLGRVAGAGLSSSQDPVQELLTRRICISPAPKEVLVIQIAFLLDNHIFLGAASLVE